MSFNMDNGLNNDLGKCLKLALRENLQEMLTDPNKLRGRLASLRGGRYGRDIDQLASFAGGNMARDYMAYRNRHKDDIENCKKLGTYWMTGKSTCVNPIDLGAARRLVDTWDEAIADCVFEAPSEQVQKISKSVLPEPQKRGEGLNIETNWAFRLFSCPRF